MARACLCADLPAMLRIALQAGAQSLSSPAGNPGAEPGGGHEMAAADLHAAELTGEQRRDHGEAEAERLLRVGLTVVGFGLEDVMMWPSVDVRKQSLAWLLKTRTTVGMAWIADRLCMGHRSNASRAVSRFRTSQGKEEHKWRRTMSQCTDPFLCPATLPEVSPQQDQAQDDPRSCSHDLENTAPQQVRVQQGMCHRAKNAGCTIKGLSLILSPIKGLSLILSLILSPPKT